jgi:hypothetical protein
MAIASSKAAAKLADLAGKHLDAMTPSERTAKLAAFKKVISESRESHPKSTKLAQTGATRSASRARG